MVNVTARFAAAQLLNLGPPPPLAAQPYETLRQGAIDKLVADLAAVGVDFDVAALESDPGVILSESAAYRDMLRRQEIDTAVAQTYLGSATAGHLDARAADYGVLRRTVAYVGVVVGGTEPTRPTGVPAQWSWDAALPGWREDDETLRIRARLAWEALSVAGPAGAYVFHAFDAHPDIADAVAYGPESGYVNPGEVLVVLQSRTGDGVPSQNVLDVVAARLDAYQVIDGNGGVRTRLVRDAQSVRPLGAKVLIEAAQPVSFYVQGTLYVAAGPDPAPILATAQARLNAYLEQRRKIGLGISLTAITAAMSVADSDGLPIVDEVVLASPLADIEPTYQQLASCSSVQLSIETR